MIIPVDRTIHTYDTYMSATVVMETNRIWDRLPDEDTDDFRRFECYRKVIGKRSMLAAYTAYIVATRGQAEVDRRKAVNPYGLSTAPPNWPIIAEDHHWLERAQAWDMYQHELDITVEQEVIDRCRDKRREALNRLLTTSISALAEFKPGDATLSQIAQAVKVAVSQLRIEYGDTDQFQLESLLAFLDANTRQAIVLALRATPLAPPALSPPVDTTVDTIDTD